MLLDSLLSFFAPHVCMGCGDTGAGLCSSCKNDIIDEKYPKCLICSSPSVGNSGICKRCRATTNIARAFVVGENKGALKSLVYNYKFGPARGHAKVLADLLAGVLPILPEGTVVVPIPTISKHIRERGFGHTELVAKLLARRKRRPYAKLLSRTDNAIQQGLKAKDRAKAAAKTFRIRPGAKMPQEIILVDDIYTTGSTIESASKLLKNAGVKTINLAILARH